METGKSAYVYKRYEIVIEQYNPHHDRWLHLITVEAEDNRSHEAAVAASGKLAHMTSNAGFKGSMYMTKETGEGVTYSLGHGPIRTKVIAHDVVE
jgi:hypothetical protein